MDGRLNGPRGHRKVAKPFPSILLWNTYAAAAHTTPSELGVRSILVSRHSKNRANSELRRSCANHRSIILSQKYTRWWFSNLPVPSGTVLSSIHALRSFFSEIWTKSCWLPIILWDTALVIFFRMNPQKVWRVWTLSTQGRVSFWDSIQQGVGLIYLGKLYNAMVAPWERYSAGHSNYSIHFLAQAKQYLSGQNVLLNW